MRRPLEDKRPIGPFAQRGSSSTLELYTTYVIDIDTGTELENSAKRNRIENQLESQLRRVGDFEVTLHPAGRTVGVEVDTNRTSATAEDEDNILGILDQAMKDVLGASQRPSEGQPSYEWKIN